MFARRGSATYRCNFKFTMQQNLSDSYEGREYGRRVVQRAIVQRDFFSSHIKIALAFVRKFIRTCRRRRLGVLKFSAPRDRSDCRNSQLRKTMKREIMLKSESRGYGAWSVDCKEGLGA